MGGDGSISEKEKELRRMSKPELIRLALSLEAQMQSMEIRMTDVEKQAKELERNRRIELSEAGSIAEASIRITNVFEEAQRAADAYLFNIRNMEEVHRREVDNKMKDAESEAKRIIDEAARQAEGIISGAKSECQRLCREAEQEAKKREQEADKYYESVKERTRSALMNLSRFNEDYERLKMIAGQQPDDAMLTVSNDVGQKKDVVGEDGAIDPAKLYKSVDSLLEQRKEAS